jgi:SAM-dependent methyltransferase
MKTEIEFDQYSEDYDAALAEVISVSGEDKNFFARGRIAWLAKNLEQLQETPKSALDFGCGTGSATPYLLEVLGVESVIGLDISPKSLDTARQLWNSPRSQFLLMDQYRPDEQIDLAFCNGVFHHIPPDERAAAIDLIYRSLRPGALFALWENNPWNPGTRYVMSRCPFDQDAIMLTPAETRSLLQAAGFEVLSTHFLFIFPKILSWFRALEPLVSRLPLGAQYQVIGRKPQAI